MKKLLLLLAFNAMYCPAYSQSKNSTEQTLTEALEKISSQGHINGFSVAIVNSDSTLYTKGFGYADVSEKKKYMANTIQT